MARGDGTAWVKRSLTLPEELWAVIFLVQKRYQKDSLNETLKYLIETSPVVQETVMMLTSRETTPAGS